MHILSPVTDNCSSWISGRGRMDIEFISWPSLHERMCTAWGSNSGRLACQADTLPIELPRYISFDWNFCASNEIGDIEVQGWILKGKKANNRLTLIHVNTSCKQTAHLTHYAKKVTYRYSIVIFTFSGPLGLYGSTSIISGGTRSPTTGAAWRNHKKNDK